MTHVKPAIGVGSGVGSKLSLFEKVSDSGPVIQFRHPMDRGQFNIYHALTAVAFVLGTVVMFAGVGASFLPSSNRAEASKDWTFFFSTWAIALAVVFLTKVLMVRARRIVRQQRRAARRNDLVFAADLAVTAQALICVGFLLWGLSARL